MAFMGEEEIHANIVIHVQPAQEKVLDWKLPPLKQQFDGFVLLWIPQMMTLNEETRCLMRLAMNREVIAEGLEEDKEITIAPIQLTNVASLEVIDPSKSPNVEIRTFSEAEQLIESDDYTEWRFFIKPIRDGVFKIMIKIATIEVFNGKERKRETVLDKEVSVLPDLGAAADIRQQAYSKEPQYAQTTFEEAPEEPESIRDRVDNWREVRSLVRDGKTDQALELAVNLARRYKRKRLEDRLTVLQARYNNLKREQQMGTISEAEAALEQNRVTEALLRIMMDEEKEM